MSFNFSVTEQQRRKKIKKITFPTKKFQKGTGEPGSSYKSRAAEASKSFPSLSPTALSRDVLPSNVSSPSEMSSSSEQMLRMFTSISVTARGTDTRRSGRAPRGVWRMREGFQGHTARPVPRRWTRARHIPEEPDVGKEVPTFLQNSLSSLKVLPPHPHPRHGHLAARRNSTFGALK